MNKQRLLQLAAFLDQLPPKKFEYMTIAREGKKPMLEALKARDENCGTAACAMGWTPAVFPDLVAWRKHTYRDGRPYPKAAVIDICLLEHPDIIDWDAMVSIFDISPEAADYLFTPGLAAHGYSGLGDDALPTEVAAHIRAFVQRTEEES